MVKGGMHYVEHTCITDHRGRNAVFFPARLVNLYGVV